MKAVVNKILLADTAKNWPLPNDSVDLIVTSPPYWQHRDNGQATTTIFDEDPACTHKWQNTSVKHQATCIKCTAWKGQLGLEPNPSDYIRHLTHIFNHEGKRVLKSTGQLWVNLGDCFAKEGNQGWVQKKQKLFLPARFAIAMQDAGWVLRSDIIWAKSVAFPDGSSKGGTLPSSVHSRFNISHEYFYFFVKPSSERRTYHLDKKNGIVSWSKDGNGDWETRDYFSCLDNVRIKQIWVDAEGNRTDLYGRPMGSRPNAGGSPKQHAAGQPHLYMFNHPLGKNPYSVWQFNTEPFAGEHNSPFPPKLIQRIILFACPENVCSKCGLPVEKFYDREKKQTRRAECRCNDTFHSGVVLDPFMGSGSAAIAALRENRTFVGLELNPHYLQVSRKRIRSEFPNLHQPKVEHFLIAKSEHH
jgi:site-specific DNA-methyltransferase (adenine-specific)